MPIPNNGSFSLGPPMTESFSFAVEALCDKLSLSTNYFRLVFDPLTGIWVLRGPFRDEKQGDQPGSFLAQGTALTSQNAYKDARDWLSTKWKPPAK